MSVPKIATHTVQILKYLGVNVEGVPEMEKTPQRYARALQEMTQGYRENPYEALRHALFSSDTYDEMILETGIEFTSLCEHHILPFHGTVAIGYLPGKHIIGISKLARVVHIFSRRLQIQERLTMEVAKVINDELKPKGIGVLIKAHHTCMSGRGIKQSGAMLTTSRMLGLFRDSPTVREEFLRLCQQ